jgi:hypothetical protein
MRERKLVAQEQTIDVRFYEYKKRRVHEPLSDAEASILWGDLNPQTPPEKLTERSGDPDPEIRRRVARNPGTPLGTLDALACDPDGIVRFWVGRNPSTAAHILINLSRDKEELARWGVSQNKSAPADLLARMVNESNKELQSELLQHPSLPISALEELATTDFAWEVAEHPNTTPELLDRLSFSSDANVRCGVARHPRVWRSTLKHLSEDAAEHIRFWAQRALGTMCVESPEVDPGSELWRGFVSVRDALSRWLSTAWPIGEEVAIDRGRDGQERGTITGYSTIGELQIEEKSVFGNISWFNPLTDKVVRGQSVGATSKMIQ